MKHCCFGKIQRIITSFCWLLVRIWLRLHWKVGSAQAHHIRNQSMGFLAQNDHFWQSLGFHPTFQSSSNNKPSSLLASSPHPGPTGLRVQTAGHMPNVPDQRHERRQHHFQVKSVTQIKGFQVSRQLSWWINHFWGPTNVCSVGKYYLQHVLGGIAEFSEFSEKWRLR